MSAVKVELAPRFLKELERLGRKFPRALDEVSTLVETLKIGGRPGDKIPKVGHDVYKVRLANPSAGRGKRGGFRTIYYFRQTDHVFLLTIYSKTAQEDISTEDIRQMIGALPSPKPFLKEEPPPTEDSSS